MSPQEYRALVNRLEAIQSNELTESQLDEINWKKAAAGVAATAALAGGVGASDVQAQSAPQSASQQAGATFSDVQASIKGVDRMVGAANYVFDEAWREAFNARDDLARLRGEVIKNPLQLPANFDIAQQKKNKLASDIHTVRGSQGVVQGQMDMGKLWKSMSRAEQQKTLNAMVSTFAK
jgi:hypothetical protein